MKTWAIGVQYQGTAYSGWQSQQSGVDTVQDRVQSVLSSVANHPVKIICAGRTDAGVHALNQVAHFQSAAARDGCAWRMGANSMLPSDISLQWVEVMPDDFHARFGATARRYQYIIDNSRNRPAIFANHVSWVYTPLDHQQMQKAGQALIGRHDFSAFRGAKCQAHSPVRTIESLTVERHGQYIFIDIKANAFLLHMVRNIAGVLIAIGQGEKEVGWSTEVLLSQDRTLAGITAAPDGLYFCDVEYPVQYAIPRFNQDVKSLFLNRGWANE